MAFKTQLRLEQITGSVVDVKPSSLAEGVDASAAAHGDVKEMLAYYAQAISNIHGDLEFGGAAVATFLGDGSNINRFGADGDSARLLADGTNMVLDSRVADVDMEFKVNNDGDAETLVFSAIAAAPALRMDGTNPLELGADTRKLHWDSNDLRLDAGADSMIISSSLSISKFSDEIAVMADSYYGAGTPDSAVVSIAGAGITLFGQAVPVKVFSDADVIFEDGSEVEIARMDASGLSLLMAGQNKVEFDDAGKYIHRNDDDILAMVSDGAMRHQSAGELKQAVGGNLIEEVTGDHTLTAVSSSMTLSGDRLLTVGGEYRLDASGNVTLAAGADGTVDIISGLDDLSLESGNDINLSADDDIYLTATDNIDLTADNDIVLNAGAILGLSGANGIKFHTDDTFDYSARGGVVESEIYLALENDAADLKASFNADDITVLSAMKSLKDSVTALEAQATPTLFSTEIAAQVAAGTGVSLSAVAGDSGAFPATIAPNECEVYVNGQLLFSGSSAEVTAGTADYYVSGQGELTFAFDVEIDDRVTLIDRGAETVGF